jgi:hypothetical protein
VEDLIFVALPGGHQCLAPPVVHGDAVVGIQTDGYEEVTVITESELRYAALVEALQRREVIPTA